MEIIRPHFRNFFFCDLETSGNDPARHGILDFCMIVSDLNLNPIDVFQRRVRPPFLSRRFWSKEAEAVHGISFEQAERGMPNEQFCYELLCFLAKYKHENNWPQPFVCHASPNGKPAFGMNGKPNGSYEIWPWFDWHFLQWSMRYARFSNGQEMIWSLNKIFGEHERFSTIKIAREMGFKGNRLSEWAKRINFNLNHHDATSDTLCCLEVFKYLVRYNQHGI